MDGYVRRPEDVEAERAAIDLVIQCEKDCAARFGGQIPWPGLYMAPIVVLPPMWPCAELELKARGVGTG
jgi:hypothetical protein